MPSPDIMITHMDNAIVIDKLVKDYGTFRALRGVSLSIARGEAFGFLGPNGAGKTTVMGIINCFIRPTGGRVEVLGMDVTREPRKIKARQGVMPQLDNIDPDLSVIDNLIVYARYFDIPPSVSRPKANELLEFVGLADRAKDNILALSGGMRRRLLLGRALVNDPEIIILDEPTTGMDPHSRRAAWANLERLKAEGKTIVLTTHYMEEADRICDRIAVIDHGRVIAIDTPDGLKASTGAGDLEEVYLKLTGRPFEEDV